MANDALTSSAPAVEAPRLSANDVQPTEPMRLGAASNFSQGWNEALFQSALALPLTNWRDSIRWADVEKTPGHYEFTTPMTSYPARLATRNARLTLTLNWGNPLYDAGQTPHSTEALAAFANFVTELVRRYPAIDTLEIGNEINGNNFVNGVVRESSLAQRRRYHLAMVRAAAEGVRAAGSKVRVIGGSVHSLPAGFLWPLLDSPGAKDLAGLALHPYTTPIDQLPSQIGVLRRHPLLRNMPLHVTEFGSVDPASAADDLVRSYATLSSLGFSEMDWYPMNDRGDGFVPLLRRDGSITEVGRAFRFANDRLARFRASNLSPAPFTFIHAFGPDLWALWGAPRKVWIDTAEVTAFDATGHALAPEQLALDETRVLILQGRRKLASPENVKLGCLSLIADSFLGFSYPAKGIRSVPTGFASFTLNAQHTVPLETLPGQQGDGVPWTPYLGRTTAAFPRVSADLAIPGPSDDALLLEFPAARTGMLRIVGEFSAANPGAQLPSISLQVNGRDIQPLPSSKSSTINRRVDVQKGGTLGFAIRWNRTARDSAVKYRIRLFDDAVCPV
ncbi:MAG: hypothetical protein DI555_00490 [Novosphingobium pentaromativorans]|uniref:Asl1-like glycosyl hydrolase catalytic domain-containing protein n=1 Tax=Novosphingobium pentaromativorans TaxID=205844 RepID=A0A2W5NZY4_9SPHN|nr:hypothetical protein [Novosphingobium panipatense]PZQ57449.1 MAG: hypothetical protein DI555_00490 [Novosphingobium pentaromativorans]